MIRRGPPTQHTVLALARGGHTVAGVRVGELSLERSVFRVTAAVVVVHVRLLVGVLHGVHVALVSLGRGAVHSIQRTLVALLKQRGRSLATTLNKKQSHDENMLP